MPEAASCQAGRAALLVGIDFGVAGNSDAHVLDGWAEPEAHHRWTVGRQSRLHLPVAHPDTDCVLVINATPCRHPPHLTGQTVMLAVDDRLLATVAFSALQVMAFRLPRGLAAAGGVVLGVTHLSASVPRAPEQWRGGQPLGLMMHSVRVFRLRPTDAKPIFMPRLDGPAVERRTGMTLAALAERFESLGQGCQFGLVQRQCGAEPLGLLRFVDTTTSHLFEGLVAGFYGVGAPGRLALLFSDNQDGFSVNQDGDRRC